MMLIADPARDEVREQCDVQVRDTVVSDTASHVVAHGRPSNHLSMGVSMCVSLAVAVDFTKLAPDEQDQAA